MVFTQILLSLKSSKFNRVYLKKIHILCHMHGLADTKKTNL